MTELVEADSLSTFCHQSRMDLRTRLTLFLEVCDAIAFCHTKGVIHRDLKPENILVLRDGERVSAKVIDFGIALAEDAADRVVSAIGGTPRYMAPEQTIPGAVLDQRTDVYGLGGCLYEMLTGRHPLGSAT